MSSSIRNLIQLYSIKFVLLMKQVVWRKTFKKKLLQLKMAYTHIVKTVGLNNKKILILILEEKKEFNIWPIMLKLKNIWLTTEKKQMNFKRRE